MGGGGRRRVFLLVAVVLNLLASPLRSDWLTSRSERACQHTNSGLALRPRCAQGSKVEMFNQTVETKRLRDLVALFQRVEPATKVSSSPTHPPTHRER